MPGLVVDPSERELDERRPGQRQAAAPSRRSLLGGAAVAGTVIFGWFAVGASRVLPYIHRPDESTNFNLVRQMFDARRLNPEWFHYPSLMFYVQGIVHAPFAVLGDPPRVVIQSIGNSWAPSSTPVLAGRLLTCAFATVLCLLVGSLVLRVVRRPPWAVVAVVLTAVSPLVVYNATLITPDVYAAVFATAACLAALRLAEADSWRIYLAAGLLVGLAAGSKYNAALCCVAVVVAHLLGPQPRRVSRLLAAAGVAGVAFLITTPYAVLDHERFVDDVRWEIDHYSSTHPGSSGGSTAWFYLSSAWVAVGPALLLAVVAVVLPTWRRTSTVLASFVVVYLAFISRYPVRFDRNLMLVVGPMIALTVIGGAALAGAILDRLPRLQMSAWSPRAAAVVCVVLLIVPGWRAWQVVADGVRNDRAEAMAWIDRLPEGTRVGVEPYGPWIDPVRHDVTAIRLDLDEIESFSSNFDVLVLARDFHRRFTDEPERYVDEVARYEAVRAEWSVIARFEQGDSVIEVLTSPT